MYKKYWFIVLALLAPGLTVAQVPESELLDGKFSFRIGGQAFTRFKTTLRVDSETLGRGTEFSLENDTNLEETITVGRLDAGYRFTDRHSMAFSYYDIDRRGSRDLSRDIEWNGEIFPISGSVESQFQQEIIKLSYAYTFLIRPKGRNGGIRGPAHHEVQYGPAGARRQSSAERYGGRTAPGVRHPGSVPVCRQVALSGPVGMVRR